jgi:GT2 family glycosyltransferase
MYFALCILAGRLLRDDFTVTFSGVVARRDLLLEAGLFDERFIHGEDFDLWMRLLKNGARMVFSAARPAESAGARR